MERLGPLTERQLQTAKVLMVSRFNPESVGGIPSTITNLQKSWRGHIQNLSIVNPASQKEVDLDTNWDLVVFHHPSAFGIKKFLELPRELKSKSSMIWYQAVDLKTAITLNKLGVGNYRFIPSGIVGKFEVISRRLLSSYPGVLTYAISENIRDSLVDNGIAREGQVDVIQIPPNLPSEMIRPQTFGERGWGKEIVVLTVSRISPEKGIENLLEIYKGVFQFLGAMPETDIPRPVRFVLVGEATNNSYKKTVLQKLAKLPSNDKCRIEFVGRKSGSQLANLYENAHILVMPSMFDTWGLATIEALHFGLPILGFGAPGTKEIFHKSENQIGKVVYNADDGIEFLMDVAKNKALWNKFSAGALQESKKYNPQKISLELLKKLWSDRYL